MNKKPIITDEEYSKEVKLYSDYLNWIFGLSTFFLAIACLQFPTPWRAAVICLGAVVPMYVHAFLNFPASLRILRRLHKETKDECVRETIKNLEKKFHGWNVFFSYPILWFGLALFLFVLTSNSFQPALDWIKS